MKLVSNDVLAVAVKRFGKAKAFAIFGERIGDERYKKLKAVTCSDILAIEEVPDDCYAKQKVREALGASNINTLKESDIPVGECLFIFNSSKNSRQVQSAALQKAIKCATTEMELWQIACAARKAGRTVCDSDLVYAEAISTLKKIYEPQFEICKTISERVELVPKGFHLGENALPEIRTMVERKVLSLFNSKLDIASTLLEVAEVKQKAEEYLLIEFPDVKDQVEANLKNKAELVYKAMLGELKNSDDIVAWANFHKGLSEFLLILPTSVLGRTGNKFLDLLKLEYENAKSFADYYRILDFEIGRDSSGHDALEGMRTTAKTLKQWTTYLEKLTELRKKAPYTKKTENHQKYALEELAKIISRPVMHGDIVTFRKKGTDEECTYAVFNCDDPGPYRLKEWNTFMNQACPTFCEGPLFGNDMVGLFLYEIAEKFPGGTFEYEIVRICTREEFLKEITAKKTGKKESKAKEA